AKERLNFDAKFNGYMFIVIGVTMILAQGVFVRRLVKPVGEKNLALIGVIFGIIAFILLGTAPDILIKEFFSGDFFMSQFIAGLICMSCAIGLISPCISALVSLHSKPDEQGRNLGLLRSAGALARVIGPVLAGSLYFSHSAELTYKAGAVILIIPLLLAVNLKSPAQKN
ncbi:MAG: MFS transporter, partial [Opitutae bacterium]|nr:MFS transporter [Opitutae bacterium]